MQRFGVQVPALECCAERRRSAALSADTDRADCPQVWAADRPHAATRGAKCYWVGSPRQAVAHCRRLPPAERNLYEVVQADTPCHLYVDLEFRRSQEPQIVDERALDRALLRELYTLAQQLFFADEPETDHRRYSCTVLRSQSPQDAGLDWDDPRRGDKRSKHWVVHVRGCAFASNFHCGAFMRRLAARLYERHGHTTDPTRNPFFLHGATGREPHEFCVDMGVYTRNRVFRCAYSSKSGDYRPLRPERSPLADDHDDDDRHQGTPVPGGKRARTDDDRDDDDRDDDDLSEHVFLAACVQHVAPTARLLCTTEPHTGATPTGTSHRSAFLSAASPSATTTVLRASAALSVAVPRGAPSSALAEWFQAPAPKCAPAVLRVLLTDYWHALHPDTTPCPGPPTLRRAALTVLRWHPARHQLVVASRVHECALAGRAHSGNHVYFVVDTLRHRYSQRCHNTTHCAGRRTPARHLDGTALHRQLARESVAALFDEARLPT